MKTIETSEVNGFDVNLRNFSKESKKIG